MFADNAAERRGVQLNTKAKGNISEAKVLAEFVAQGWTVLIPFGDNEPFDLVIDRGEGFEKVQVKTGRKRNNCIEFNAYSTVGRVGNGDPVSYRGKADWFAIYFPPTNEIFLLPVEDVGEGKARILPGSKAEEYKLGSVEQRSARYPVKI